MSWFEWLVRPTDQTVYDCDVVATYKYVYLFIYLLFTTTDAYVSVRACRLLVTGSCRPQSSRTVPRRSTTWSTLRSQVQVHRPLLTRVAVDCGATWWTRVESSDFSVPSPICRCRQLFNDFCCWTNSTQYIDSGVYISAVYTFITMRPGDLIRPA